MCHSELTTQPGLKTRIEIERLYGSELQLALIMEPRPAVMPRVEKAVIDNPFPAAADYPDQESTGIFLSMARCTRL